jgi:hypothetical protein
VEIDSGIYNLLDGYGFIWSHPVAEATYLAGIRRFQRAWWGDGKAPLVIDGIAGPKTKAALAWLPKLSLHFTVYELWDSRQHECAVHRELINGLEVIRRAINGPLEVTSGYRSLNSNDIVGGAARSLHMDGLAADLKTFVNPAVVRRTGGWSGLGYKRTKAGTRVLHVDKRHILGPANPTQWATPSRPSIWYY